MPWINGPELVGLHSNVEIEYCKSEVESTWSCLRELNIRKGRKEYQLKALISRYFVSGIATENIYPLTSIEDEDSLIHDKVNELLKVIPNVYDIERVRRTFQVNITPTGVVLMQELAKFNRLVSAVETDLISLRNVSVNDISHCLICSGI